MLLLRFSSRFRMFIAHVFLLKLLEHDEDAGYFSQRCNCHCSWRLRLLLHAKAKKKKKNTSLKMYSNSSSCAAGANSSSAVDFTLPFPFSRGVCLDRTFWCLRKYWIPIVFWSLSSIIVFQGTWNTPFRVWFTWVRFHSKRSDRLDTTVWLRGIVYWQIEYFHFLGCDAMWSGRFTRTYH